MNKDKKNTKTPILNNLHKKHLIALRSAYTKLKKKPKLSDNLLELFEILKDFFENQQPKLYKNDGLLDIEE
mgnify:CR=1 FL=1